MKYNVQAQAEGDLEVIEESAIEAESPMEALKAFASEIGLQLKKQSFDYSDEYGQSVMEQEDGTVLSVVEVG